MNDFPWANGLVKHGTYYEGFVDDLEHYLELHRRHTITTWAIRISKNYDQNLLKDEDKENQGQVGWTSLLFTINFICSVSPAKGFSFLLHSMCMYTNWRICVQHATLCTLPGKCLKLIYIEMNKLPWS